MKNDVIKILLIQENSTQAALLQSPLSEMYGGQFELIQTAQFEQAIDYLSTETIDAILLDLSLPDGQGLATLMRTREYAPGIPILVLTDDDETLTRKAIQMGAQDYLVKDRLNKDVVLHSVPCAIERHRMHVQLQQYARELQVSEARFRNLITKNADGIVVIDGYGIIRFINPAAEALFGHRQEELLGEVFGFPVIAGEITEIDLVRRGTEGPGVAEMRVVETEWEDEVAYLTSIRDITQHKQTEDALRNAEMQNRAILDSLDAGIAVINQHKMVERLNKSWREMARESGMQFAHVAVGTNFFTVCEQVFGTSSHVCRGVYAVLEAETESFDTEISFAEDDGGDERWFNLRVMPVSGWPEKSIVIALNDITERKRVARIEARAEANEYRVREQEREITALLELSGSSASHAVIASNLFGMLPLHDSAPIVFEEMMRFYGEAIELALEQRAFKVKHDVSEGLRAIAERLGFLRAGPRDVVEIHSTVLQSKLKGANALKAQAYTEEGRLLVLELMGYLVSYYRNYSLGIGSNLLHETRDERQSTE